MWRRCLVALYFVGADKAPMQSALAAAGAVAPVVRLCRSPQPEVQAEAVDVVKVLSRHPRAARIIVDLGQPPGPSPLCCHILSSLPDVQCRCCMAAHLHSGAESRLRVSPMACWMGIFQVRPTTRVLAWDQQHVRCTVAHPPFTVPSHGVFFVQCAMPAVHASSCVAFAWWGCGLPVDGQCKDLHLL